LICMDCHKVIEFCDPRVQQIQSTVSDVLEFHVMHHSLILYGNCNKQNCENK
jgi:Fur family ferric uptake transcriptional regulator